MNPYLRSLLVAAALVATPSALRAEAAKASCPAEGAGCASAKAASCADAKTAQCSEGKGAACCAAKTQNVSLKLKNADCTGLQKALSQVKGVGSVETCPDSKFTKVAYNKDQVKEAKILAALKKAGYQVEAQRVTYAVQGMACGSCADKISGVLSKVKGVAEAKVCSESKTATIDFDPAKVSSSKIMAAINGAGFKASESIN